MENSIQISIVIPIFNAASYLNRCLTSISNQTFINFEVIIIDDGSTDSSKQIYQAFEKSDSRFRSYYQSNSGPSVARNVGIEKSNGDYIAFIDADDYVTPNYLKDLYKAIIDNNLNLACCGYFELSKNNTNPYPVNDFKNFNSLIVKEQFIPLLFKGTAGVLWGKLFAAKIIKENQLKLNPEIKMSEDLVFVLDYAFHIDEVAILNKHNYYYNRFNEKGLSSNQDYSYINYLKLSNIAIEDILLKNKYNLVAFDKYKKSRLWSLIKMITFNEAVTHKKLGEKTNYIIKILENEYVMQRINKLTEPNIFFSLQLFLLKKRWIGFFVIYCKLHKFILNLKKRNK